MTEVQPNWKQPQARKSSKRIKAMSDKRRKANESHAVIREAVFARDSHLCRLRGVQEAGECFGVLTPHHVRKASQGGTYSPENLVALCAHHNEQLEADADLDRLARQLGLVVRRTQ
jgi:hypothetical protein